MKKRLLVMEETAVLNIPTGNLALLGSNSTDCLKANTGVKPRTTLNKKSQ
jgi:hypothetical protein